MWGWDCHGLPIENLIEKDLVTGDARQDRGVWRAGEVQRACRLRVLEYADGGMGEVVPYGALGGNEALLSHHGRGLYGVRVVGVQELHNKKDALRGIPAHSYLSALRLYHAFGFGGWVELQDVTDPSVTVRFKVVGEPNTSLLAWTTTRGRCPPTVTAERARAVPAASSQVTQRVLIVANIDAKGVGWRI